MSSFTDETLESFFLDLIVLKLCQSTQKVQYWERVWLLIKLQLVDVASSTLYGIQRPDGIVEKTDTIIEQLISKKMIIRKESELEKREPNKEVWRSSILSEFKVL